MKKTSCDMETCFFCKVCPAEWLELTQLKKQSLFYKKGEQIFAEGTPATGIYFMLSGAVKVHKKWGDKDLIIRFTTGGNILGVRGFGDTIYRASATSLEETHVCFIPNDHLQASLMINPSLSYKLMQFYASELHNAEQRMNDLAHRDVKGRVVETLLMLQDMFGEDKNHFLCITISRADIASYAGTTYETVFKIFTEWTALGWIKTEGKRIQIRDKENLLTSII
jgi:CRP-like cAMP-binding protein